MAIKRRNILQGALVAAPAAHLLAPQLAAQQGGPGAATMEYPKIDIVQPKDAASPVATFFNPSQLAALAHLAQLVMPARGKNPGAIEAGVPEFLDFLLSESGAERQLLYRTGLDLLQGGAAKKYKKPFEKLDAAESAAMLAPLRAPWTYEPSPDPLQRFLVAAKQDIRAATMNSKEFVTAAGAAGRRGGGGAGLYWNSLD